MRLDKTISAEELQVVSRFESLRKMLLSETYVEHLDKPLAYWALPTDRRLPLAFLGRVRCATCWTRRLSTCRPRRASAEKKLLPSCSYWPARPIPIPPCCPPKCSIRHRMGSRPMADGESAPCDGFDPTNISEVTWAQWRASVVHHGLGSETAGPFRPQPAKHDPRDLEHAAERVHQFHAGRNPRA